MIVNGGFSVENYVGTYEIREIQGELCIISKEKQDGSTASLKKKRIQEVLNKDTYLTLEFANIDIDSNDAIRAFCNQYGLPISSQLLEDAEDGYHISGLEVSEKIYAQYDPYYRYDVMSVSEFRRLVVVVRNALELKTLLEKPPEDCAKMIPSFLYMLLFSRKYFYDYDADDPYIQDPCMRFQYRFQHFCTNRVGDSGNGLTVATCILFYLDYLKHRKFQPTDSMEISDYSLPLWGKLINFLILFVKNGNDAELTEDLQLNFTAPLTYSGDPKILYELASAALCGYINESSLRVSPNLRYQNGKIQGDWAIPDLVTGINIELFSMVSVDNMVRKCADPSCNHFFRVGKSRIDKKYCCITCATRMAKRMQRSREKEKLLAASESS